MSRTQYLVTAIAIPLLLASCSEDASPPSGPRIEPPPNAAIRAIASRASHLQIKQLGADATFITYDPSGCVETDVVVLGGEQAFHEAPGKPRTGPFAVVQVFQVDYCTGEQLGGIISSTEDATFQAERTKLTAASLRATIPAYDYIRNADVQVEVDVTWTGTGDLGSVASHFRSKQPGALLNQQVKGTTRPAAASGTVTVEGENLTPNAAEFAEIVRVRLGQVDIVTRTR